MGSGIALRSILAMCLAVGAGALHSQSFDLNAGRQPVVSLDGPWHFQPGDSPVVAGEPVWARPDFNDSAWPSLLSSKPWTEQGHPGMGGYAWYRFAVRIPAGSPHTALLLAPSVSSYAVYIDGKLIGGRGNMPPANLPSGEFSYHFFPLTSDTAPHERTLHVALRMWHAPIWANYVGGGPLQPGNLAGDPDLLKAEQRHHQNARNLAFVDAYAYSIIAAIVGFTILCLFLARPAEREYLWFACMLLAQAADNVLYVGEGVFYWFPTPVSDFVDASLVALNICAPLLFFSRILGNKPGRLGRLCLLLAIVSPPMAVLYAAGFASPAASASTQILLLLPAVLWILYRLVESAIRGNLDARLLLIPTVLDLGFYFADNLAIVLAQAGITHRPHLFEVRLPLPPFSVQTGILLHILFLVALLIFLIRRFSRARQQEERMASEFEAARQVQEMLLPEELDLCPGFHVESTYLPADRVGGDFFQQIADGHGGMLIVVGDVSGKGLPAAMIVSVLVGAIRAEAAHGTHPATLLDALNERMMGRSHGGFITCLAAHLSGEGVLSVANAGHLPPYINGEELPAIGALPLGFLHDQHYEVSSVQLQPGDRITFVSDGVVEAMSRTGELFGFERTRALSQNSPETIARTAVEFGQNDDITVVSVRYNGIPCSGADGVTTSQMPIDSRPATA